MFKLNTASHVASVLGSRPMQTPMAMDTDTMTLGACQSFQLTTTSAATFADFGASTFHPLLPYQQLPAFPPYGESLLSQQPISYTSEFVATRTDLTVRHTANDTAAAQSLLTLQHRSLCRSKTFSARLHKQRSTHDSVPEWLEQVTAAAPLVPPPSVAESNIASARQSTIPTSRTTLRSRHSSGSLLAVEIMVRMADQNRADAMHREQLAIHRETLAARRDELAHTEKQTLVQEVARREEIWLKRSVKKNKFWFKMQLAGKN